MSRPEDPRLSDEATGLPPLGLIQPDDYPMMVLAWEGGEGIVQMPNNGETIAVRYLHLRGLVPSVDDPTTAEWSQIHVAVPASSARQLAAALVAGNWSL